MEKIQFSQYQPNEHVAVGKDKGNGHILQEVSPWIHNKINSKIPGNRCRNRILTIQGVVVVIDLPAQGAVAYEKDTCKEYIEQKGQEEQIFHGPISNQ